MPRRLVLLLYLLPQKMRDVESKKLRCFLNYNLDKVCQAATLPSYLLRKRSRKTEKKRNQLNRSLGLDVKNIFA